MAWHAQWQVICARRKPEGAAHRMIRLRNYQRWLSGAANPVTWNVCNIQNYSSCAICVLISSA